MKLNNIGIEVADDDDTRYYPPADFNPNGWLSIGRMATLSLPNDPDKALLYLGDLAATIETARRIITETTRNNEHYTKHSN